MPHGIAIFEAYEEIPIFDSKNEPLVSFFTLQAASATLCMLAAAKAPARDSQGAKHIPQREERDMKANWYQFYHIQVYQFWHLEELQVNHETA